MYRNLLALIPTEASARPVVDGAVSLATAFDAHLDAIAVGYETTSISLVDGGAAIASVLEFEHERALERANAALAIFEAEAKKAGIRYHCRAVNAMPGDAASMIGPAARIRDLTVVAQPDIHRSGFDNMLAQEMMFQAGGPVLYMPYTFHGTFAAKRIGICWDGGRLAARALRDAMPLLGKADTLIVITVNEKDEVPPEASPTYLARALAQAGLPVRVVELDIDRSQIQSGILSLAADESLDLLVMGGYGHSRLKEMVLGGVTREMLRSMTVPTLMSH